MPKFKSGPLACLAAFGGASFVAYNVLVPEKGPNAPPPGLQAVRVLLSGPNCFEANYDGPPRNQLEENWQAARANFKQSKYSAHLKQVIEDTHLHVCDKTPQMQQNGSDGIYEIYLHRVHIDSSKNGQIFSM